MTKNHNTYMVSYRAKRGEKPKYTGFILLDVYYEGKNLVYIGQSIDTGEIVHYYDKYIIGRPTMIMAYNERVVTVKTNWYKKVDGKYVFNHQTDFKDQQLLSPTIVNDVYGLQERWKNDFWKKVNLYFINDVYVGRTRIC